MHVRIWKSDVLANGGDLTAFGLVRSVMFVPAIKILIYYRVAKWAKNKGIFFRILARMLWRRIVKISGCYFSLDATIGSGLILPHPVGIVIGDGAVVQACVTIFQHVTLGRADNQTEGYPIVESGAILYAGAVVIGDIIIGSGAKIGANAVVLQSIPKHRTAAGVPAKIIEARCDLRSKGCSKTS